jgi:glutaconyl-CoA decarboxylase
MSISIGDSLLVGVFGLAVVFIVLIGLNLLVRLQSALVVRFTKPKPAAAKAGALHEDAYVDAMPAAHHFPEETMPEAVPAQTAEAPKPEGEVPPPLSDTPVWVVKQAGSHAGSKHAATPAAEGPATVISPAPGRVIELKVTAGATVRRGQILLLLDAMNMENEIEAPKDGTVSQILTSNGATVATGTPLVEIQ